MKTSDFDYQLPPEYIAQTPIEPRDSARLLVLDRLSGDISHTHFRDLGDHLRPGDLLVINETRVIQARLYARKYPTGGRVEILLLRKESETAWEILVGGRGLGVGSRLQVEAGPMGEIVADLNGAHRLIRFVEAIESYLPQAGHVPTPPYIHVPLEDPERYQTVFAHHPGSAAAPTAGLHFTNELVDKLKDLGVRFTHLTLHIGLDTFAPVQESDPRRHKIHTEWCQVSSEAARQINRVRREGGRVIAVGTTSVRTLESAARNALPDELVGVIEGPTDLFILPGYQFQVVDALITNFHLPRSTLLMLVSAFAGREKIFQAYRIAIEKGYRFYSFGDAMLII